MHRLTFHFNISLDEARALVSVYGIAYPTTDLAEKLRELETLENVSPSEFIQVFLIIISLLLTYMLKHGKRPESTLMVLPLCLVRVDRQSLDLRLTWLLYKV